MDLYPYKFTPIYKEKIWGGRNLARLLGRDLSGDASIGESWELADLAEGTSVVSNGPERGRTLTELTETLGDALLGGAAPEKGRFPLLLKYLDANDKLSLQVHPDAEAVERIGGDAALKTECWYVLESRDGYIYKGVEPEVTPAQFREAIKQNAVERLVRRYDVSAGDFHYLPAGTVHALCAGVVVAEVQTPSDTTYRVTDWGRGREIHVDRSMECIHFEPAADPPPGAEGETLLVTAFFTVARRELAAGERRDLPVGRCTALMFLSGDAPARIECTGGADVDVTGGRGETLLVPAGLESAAVIAESGCVCLEVTLPVDSLN